MNDISVYDYQAILEHAHADRNYYHYDYNAIYQAAIQAPMDGRKRPTTEEAAQILKDHDISETGFWDEYGRGVVSQKGEGRLPIGEAFDRQARILGYNERGIYRESIPLKEVEANPDMFPTYAVFIDPDMPDMDVDACMVCHYSSQEVADYFTARNAITIPTGPIKTWKGLVKALGLTYNTAGALNGYWTRMCGDGDRMFAVMFEFNGQHVVNYVGVRVFSGVTRRSHDFCDYYRYLHMSLADYYRDVADFCVETLKTYAK